MIQESFAILLVCLLLVIVFSRSKHPGYLVGTLPIAIIPIAHLLISLLLRFSKGTFLGFRAAIVAAFVDVLALVITCALVVVFSTKIESPKNRNIYLVMMLAYSLLLGWAYIYNSVRPLLIAVVK